MTSRRRTAARTAVVGALTLVVWVLQGPAAQQAPHTEHTGPAITHTVESWDVDTATDAPRVEEDSPLWDCHTMGNRVCGPTA